MNASLCGTLEGFLAHQAAGEPACGWCARADAVEALIAEGIPRGLPAAPAKVSAQAPLGRYKPVTARQAAQHRRDLERELDDRDRARHLQLVKPGRAARAS